MYREPHLQKKSDECARLWREWESLPAKKDLGAPEARRKWCECCDEFSTMCHEEVKTNPRYINAPKMFWSNEPPPPPPE